jgi:hypothetical protein
MTIPASADQPRRGEQCEDPYGEQPLSAIWSWVLVFLGLAGVGLLSWAGFLVAGWLGFAMVLGFGCLVLVPFIRFYVIDWS